MVQYSKSNKVMEVKNHSENGAERTKKLMKSMFCLLLLFSAYFAYGQENVVKRPERVIIANDKIITMEQLSEYEKERYIKAMHNGVSDKERDRLFELFGDKIPPKEFIMYIKLRTEEEWLQNENVRNAPAINVNDNRRDFTVRMIDETTIKLSELSGNVVLLNFWATWCAPCIREFYAFPSEIIEPFKNSTFVLLPISSGETADKVKHKMAELKNYGIDFNVGIDPDKTITALYRASGLPLNFLIDKKGVIRYISEGYTDENLNNISSMIKKLLNE